MKALSDFIIEPKGDRYNNSVDVDGKSLILNTEIVNHLYVNREAKVLATPLLGETELQEGDTVLVHHNVFRRWHDVKGRERNSRSYFEEGKYFVKEDQIYLYKTYDHWKPLKGYCFVKPVLSEDMFSTDKEKPLVGIVKYTDGTVEENELIGFKPNSEYEFTVDGERLYRVLSSFITIKYEYKGNEEEYNPSWASCG